MDICYHCSGLLRGEWQKKFCSKSCAASYNNVVAPKRKKESLCKRCSKPTSATRAFCYGCIPKHLSKQEAQKLVAAFKAEEMIELWLKGDWRGGTDAGLSDTVRNYLMRQAGHKCTRCDWSVTHPDTGEVPLEINHIDGDGLNHDPSNLEVVCPNCHSLTSSYRGRNRGNGRPVFYRRVSR